MLFAKNNNSERPDIFFKINVIGPSFEFIKKRRHFMILNQQTVESYTEHKPNQANKKKKESSRAQLRQIQILKNWLFSHFLNQIPS